jgi:glycosyltransferase involved in cell wall biosynthesis
VVESLALGTPVVGMARGCLPELIDDGVTGLLTTEEDALGDLVHKAGTVDPGACRAEAERRFAPAVMAAAYLDLYERLR